MHLDDAAAEAGWKSSTKQVLRYGHDIKHDFIFVCKSRAFPYVLGCWGHCVTKEANVLVGVTTNTTEPRPLTATTLISDSTITN